MTASNNKLAERKIDEGKIRNICEEMTAIYKFIDREMEAGKLEVPWRDDSEKFIALNFSATDTLNKHSENLVEHSKNLVKQSNKLTWLTKALFVLAFVQILLFICYR